MPYFIYKIQQPKRLDYVAEYPDYKSAKKAVTEKRATLQASDNCTLKIIFAKTTEHAEKDFMVERDPIPLGEDA